MSDAGKSPIGTLIIEEKMVTINLHQHLSTEVLHLKEICCIFLIRDAEVLGS